VLLLLLRKSLLHKKEAEQPYLDLDPLAAGLDQLAEGGGGRRREGGGRAEEGAEEGADDAAKRHLIPNRPCSTEGSAAPGAAAAGGDGSPKGTSGCAPPPPSLRTTGYAQGRDAAAGAEERRADAQDARSEGARELLLHSAAQGRAWADGDFDADHGFGLDGVGRSAQGPIRAGRAASEGWGRRLRARPCCA
jgi:hypothetical protein